MPNELGAGDGEETLGAGLPIDQRFGQAGGLPGPLGALLSLSARAVSRVLPAAPGSSSGGGSGGNRRPPGTYNQY